MGWTGEYETAHAAHKDVLRDFQNSEDLTVLGHGKAPEDKMWIALQKGTEKFVVVVLAEQLEEEGAYFSKVISEDMGPFYYDCPKKLLQKTSPGISTEWRARISA